MTLTIRVQVPGIPDPEIDLTVDEKKMGEEFDKLPRVLGKQPRSRTSRDVRTLSNMYNALISSSHAKKLEVMADLGKLPMGYGVRKEYLQRQLQILQAVQVKCWVHKNRIDDITARDPSGSGARWTSRPIVMG